MHMTAIHVVAVIMLLCMFFAYGEIEKNRRKAAETIKPVSAQTERLNLILLLGLAFIVRCICALRYDGHETDMNCFQSWANMVYSGGISNFYKTDAFTDYPPGYMYVLYIIGFLKETFHVEYNSGGAIFLTKLPAMICDLVTAWLLYKVADKRFKAKGALFITALYALSPAILLNSAIWGQVDSVFTLFVVWMCYLVTEKKLIPAYYVFAAGILIKPQTLIFTPVLIYGILDQVILHDFDWKRFYKNLAWGLGAIAMIFLFALPFGISEVWKLYNETLESYEWASVNAYNLWSMFGLDWAPQTDTFLGIAYKQWGSISIVLFVLAATVLSLKAKKSESKYYFLGAMIVACMFCFSVRMHERYVFPALILLLMAYCVRPKKELYILYALFSGAHFYNAAHVLFFYDVHAFNPKDSTIRLLSLVTVIVTGILLYFAYTLYWKADEGAELAQWNLQTGGRTGSRAGGNRKGTGAGKGKINRGGRNVPEEPSPIQASEKSEPLTRNDYIIMAVITLVYACIAFTNLGDMDAPQTEFVMQPGNELTVDLGDSVLVNQLGWFNGIEPYAKYTLQYSEDGVNWNAIAGEGEDGTYATDAAFCWHKKPINIQSRYFRFYVTEGTAYFRELVFEGMSEEVLPVESVECNVLDPEEAQNLFDEQELYPELITYMNSTYFDEIYHARTAYEMIHHMYNYEWTHPPLGKWIMSIGIRIFGMVPFGWRFMGTFLGVLMVPIMFIFGKKFFKKTWIATVLCLLFTFDFMHYVQTRISTIDVFVTFFIILMYLFMYLYTQKSFYDTKLIKTFIPLGLSGIMMGFGVASKWTGVYAGMGLAVIFFATLYKRYREYQYAQEHPMGSTNGISHGHIIESFWNHTINTCAFCLVFFVMVPCLIYLFSYIPFDNGTDQNIVAQLLKNQLDMYNYHSTLDAEHDFSSFWYQWPLMVRPMYYYSGQVADAATGAGISAFGNPLVWWAGIPAAVYMLYLIWKERDKKAAFLVVAYLAQYAPWFFVKRVIFIYHYFPSVPFVAIMVAYSFYRFAGENKTRQKVVFGYAAAGILLFAMFYPVLTGIPASWDYIKSWLVWFKSWVLG